MNTETGVSLQNVYDFVLSCGRIHEPREFAIGIIRDVERLVPFDQARVYFYNGNNRIMDQHLVGIDKKWVTAYFEYYSRIENGRYGIPLDICDEMNPYRPSSVISTRDWSDAPSDEFINDYIRPLGIKHSLGFNLYDHMGQAKVFFMLDRTTPVKYTGNEIMTLCMAVPQLNNLHKNFFVQSAGKSGIDKVDWEATGLTKREIEIASLLCHGISPNNISKKLHIAQSTTYKHIAHIYEKLHVSNRQELLVRLLNNS